MIPASMTADLFPLAKGSLEAAGYNATISKSEYGSSFYVTRVDGKSTSFHDYDKATRIIKSFGYDIVVMLLSIGGKATKSVRSEESVPLDSACSSFEEVRMQASPMWEPGYCRNCGKYRTDHVEA